MEHLRKPPVLDLKSKAANQISARPVQAFGEIANANANANAFGSSRSRSRVSIKIKKSYLALLLVVLGFAIGLFYRSTNKNFFSLADEPFVSYLRVAPLDDQTRQEILQKRKLADYLVFSPAEYNFLDALLFKNPWTSQQKNN